MLDYVARQPRQPVVGVHRGVGQPAARVGAGPGRARHASEHPGRELLDHAGQGLLGQALEGARRHVVHPQAGLHVDHLGEVGRPGPGEHVAGDAGAGECRRQLADVDVHAATVARAGLGQGRGVQGQDGEPAHGGQSLPAVGKRPPASRGGPIEAAPQAVATRPVAAGGSVAGGEPAAAAAAPGSVAARAGGRGAGRSAGPCSRCSSSCSRRNER